MNKHFLIVFFTFLVISRLQAHPSWGIVVDKHRNIYFADIAHNGRGSVWKLTNKGILELLLSNFHAHNVSLDKDGNLVTAHGEGHHTMVRMLPDGSLDTLYHTENHKDFFGGNCTYSYNDEILFGISHYIWKIERHGKKRKASDHWFEWNQTVYVDNEGIIYAPDIGIENGIIIRIDTNGVAKIIAKDLITKLDRPKDKHNDILLGITRGCDSLIYICENAGQRIIRVPGDGKTETFYKSEGDWFPTAVDFFAGDAYILEYKYTKSGMEGPQIIKVDESGAKTELFNYGNYQKGITSPTEQNNDNKSYWWIYLLTGIIILVSSIGLVRIKKHHQ